MLIRVGSSEVASLQDTPGVKLLVADDSPLVRSYLSQALTGAGHEVVVAADGREAIEKFEACAPDVVLADLKMEDLDGIEVVRALKARAPLVPVVIYTEDDEVERAVEAMREGAAGYVLKGSSIGLLIGEIGRAFEHRRIKERNRELEAANLRYQASLEATVASKTAEIARLEQVKAQSEKVLALGTIAAGIAHEINNPVAVVTSNVAWLASAIAPGLARIVALAAGSGLEAPAAKEELRAVFGPVYLEDLQDFPAMLRDTSEGCQRIARLVASLRRLSRSNLTRGHCDIAAVIAEVRTHLAPLLEGRAQLEVRIDPPDQQLPLSTADASSVLVNLLENAALAIEPGRGRISVSAVHEPSGNFVLSIQDNGCGIPPRNLERVCEPFFTTRPPGEGTGLGLCLVTHLVRAIGGDVRIESELGRGTTVNVVLPASPTESARPAGCGRYDP